MAIGSTVYKAHLEMVDLDRHYYETHDLTLARHPSETDLRLMVRLAAFALNADERLQFTRGLCAEDEPELWKKNYGGEIELWIELGQPDDKRLRRACGRSERVIVYGYQAKSASEWWHQHEASMRRFKNLSVILLDVGEIESLAERSMHLQCQISEGELTLLDEKGRSVTITQDVRL